MMAHELIHAVAAATGASRCLLVTSRMTGNPALDGVSLGRFDSVVSLQYEALPEVPGRPYSEVVRVVRRLGQFDVAFLDPWHHYRDSLDALRQFGRSTRDHGWLIVHDCLPPYPLASEELIAGPWCGSTYAAFRDFATRSDRAWFVVDDDFGLGVLGPKRTGHLVIDPIPTDLAARWGRADLAAKRELYRDQSQVLMRALPATAVDSVVARLLQDQPIEL